MIPNPIILAGAAFLLYAGVSLLWSFSPPGLATAWLGSLALCFLIGARLPSTRWVLYGYVWLVAAFLCAQPWLPISVNQNAVGCGIVMALAAALLYEIWFFYPIGLLGLWFTQSRGALFAAGVIGALYLWRRFPTVAACMFILSAVAGSLVWQTKVEVNVVDNIAQRFGIWQDTINHLSPFGSGLGSFADAYASWPIHRNMTGTLTAHAYNDFLELVFELGLGTIPLWILIVLCLEVQAPIRLIAFAFLLCSLTFFPLFVAPLGQLFALILGRLAHERKPYGSVATLPSALLERSRYRMGAQGG